MTRTLEKELLFGMRYGKNPQTQKPFTKEEIEQAKEFAKKLGIIEKGNQNCDFKINEVVVIEED